MAELTSKDVHDIADLARLALGAEEAERLRGELSKILGFIEQLQECDTAGIEPMTHAVPMDCPLRDDIADPSLTPDEALGGAPRRAEGFFEVPKIIGDHS
jgi:aspartyl-tRNA(Asn)/glutamyl-tRNA(Gln) amidotransferase subunit C